MRFSSLQTFDNSNFNYPGAGSLQCSRVQVYFCGLLQIFVFPCQYIQFQVNKVQNSIQNAHFFFVLECFYNFNYKFLTHWKTVKTKQNIKICRSICAYHIKFFFIWESKKRKKYLASWNLLMKLLKFDDLFYFV